MARRRPRLACQDGEDGSDGDVVDNFPGQRYFKGLDSTGGKALELDGGGECVSGFLNASAFLSHVSTIVNIMPATPRVVLSAT